MYLIIGLGNPGSKYEKTRHNVGFIAIDKLSKYYAGNVNKLKYKALISDKFKIQGESVILVKPQTFMNISGESVIQISNFYKIQHSKIIVIHDELAFNLDAVKIKINGGAGGHNGVKSLIQHLGTQNFIRVRVGINTDNKHPNTKLSDYVLQNFSDPEFEIINNVLDKVVLIVNEIIGNSVESAMNNFN